jgi:hypothetical protein
MVGGDSETPLLPHTERDDYYEGLTTKFSFLVALPKVKKFTAGHARIQRGSGRFFLSERRGHVSSPK